MLIFPVQDSATCTNPPLKLIPSGKLTFDSTRTGLLSNESLTLEGYSEKMFAHSKTIFC